MSADKISSEKGFAERLQAVRTTQKESGVPNPKTYKNGQVSDSQSDSAWDNFDRYYKFFN